MVGFQNVVLQSCAIVGRATSALTPLENTSVLAMFAPSVEFSCAAISSRCKARPLARGNHPNFEKTLLELGLKFWRPTNAESRSESCFENKVCT